VTQICLYPISS